MTRFALATLFLLVGCKSVHWLPESQFDALRDWRAGTRTVLVATDGREVTLSRRTYLALDHGEGTDRIVERFDAISLDQERFVGDPSPRGHVEVSLPREDLRIGAVRRNWRKTAIITAVITAVVVAVVGAVFIGVNVHCNRNPDEPGCSGTGDGGD